MAETPWRKEQLSNGASAYIIPCKQNPEKPLMIHFGLKTCHLAVCGLCLCGRLFNLDSNYGDVATWCRKHWDRYATAEGSIEVHDTKQYYSLGALSDMLRESSGATSKRQLIGPRPTSIPRSILLPQTWLMSTFGATKIKVLKGDRPQKRLTSICNKCLRPSNQSGCCQGSQLITVFRLQAGKCMEPLLCTDNSQLLAHEAEVQARLSQDETGANHWQVPPPPPQNTSESSVSAGTPFVLISHPPPPSLPHMTPGSSASTSTTSSHYSPVPFPSLGAFQPATVVPTSQSSIQNLLGEGREYVSLLYIDPMFVEESKAFVDQNGGVCSVEGTRRGKKDHDRDDPERELLERLKFPGGRRPDPETIQRYAKAHTFDKTVSVDVLLFEISGLLTDRLLGGVTAVNDTMLLIFASRLPRIAGHVPDMPAMNDLDVRVLTLKEFDPSLATYKRRKRAVFVLMKMIKDLPEVLGHLEVNWAYQRIEDLCGKRKAEQNLPTLVHALGSLWKESQGDVELVFRSVGIMIGVLESYIKGEEARGRVLFQALAFGPVRERRARYPPALIDNDDGEDEELGNQAEAEAELEAEDEQVQQSVAVPLGVRSPREVAEDLGDILSVLKYVSVYPMSIEQRLRNADAKRFEELRGQHMESSQEGQGIAHKQQCLPSLLRLYYERYEKTSFTPSIAKLIADLNRMQGLSTSLVNVWQQDIGDFGPVFANGVMRVDFRLLRKGFQRLVHLLEADLFDMLIPVLNPVAVQQTAQGPSSTVDGPSTQSGDSSPPLMKFHQKQYYKALFREPSVEKFRVRVEDGSACPHLDPTAHDDPVAQQLWQDLTAAYRADKNGFSRGAEQFRKHVLSLVDMLGSSTMRTLDLLDVHRGLDTVRPGNVVGYKTKNEEHGLLIMKFVQKTGVEGMSFVPPFAARLFLVLLDLVAPHFARTLAEDCLRIMPANLVADLHLGLEDYCSRGLRSFADADYLRIASGARDVIKTWQTATRLNLDQTGKLLTGFRDQGEGQPAEDLGSLPLEERVLVGRLSDQRGRDLVRDGVCGDALELPSMTLWQKRSLFVNFRFHMPDYIDIMMRVVDDGDVRAALGDVKEKMTRCGNLWQNLAQGRVTGQHSAKTQFTSYADGKVMYSSSGDQVKVPGLLLTNTREGTFEKETIFK